MGHHCRPCRAAPGNQPILAEHEVITEVPASSTNLGPGFDCLGVALTLCSRVRISRIDEGPLRPPNPFCEEAVAAFFESAGVARFPVKWEISGEVPISRGLGSSVTLRLGILAGLNRLSGSPLSRHGLFELCSLLEGHPDNAGPGAFGGFAVTNHANRILRFEVAPELKFVFLVPDLEILTSEARAALPRRVTHRQAAENLANTALIAAAFASRNYDALEGLFVDHLHEPFRKPLIPGADAIIAAGSAAGALGGFVSGSGSALACVVHEKDPAGTVAAGVADAMVAARRTEDEAQTLILCTDNRGLRVIMEDGKPVVEEKS